MSIGWGPMFLFFVKSKAKFCFREVSCLRVRYEGIGVEVAEGLESRQLNPGDRLVEISGEPVLR